MPPSEDRIFGVFRVANKKLIRAIVHESGHQRLPKMRKGHRNMIDNVTSTGPVNRVFNRDAPNILWITDIIVPLTRNRRVFYCAVLHAWSDKVLGWKTPAEAVNKQLLSLHQTGVVTTG